MGFEGCPRGKCASSWANAETISLAVAAASAGHKKGVKGTKAHRQCKRHHQTVGLTRRIVNAAERQNLRHFAVQRNADAHTRVHKKSATYFYNSWRNSTNKAKQQVGGGEMVAIAVQTAVVDVMASGEFCNMRRRVAHLLTMYGFVIYVVTTVIMVFVYPTLPPLRPPIYRHCGTSGP